MSHLQLQLRDKHWADSLAIMICTIYADFLRISMATQLAKRKLWLKECSCIWVLTYFHRSVLRLHETKENIPYNSGRAHQPQRKQYRPFA